MTSTTRLAVTRLEDRATPTADLTTGYAADRVLVSVAAPPFVRSTDAVVGLDAVTAADAIAPDLLRATLEPGVSVADAVAAINALPRVHARPDYLLAPAAVPNDSRYASLWAHTAMNSAAAWNVTTGTGNTIVAVIDSGVDLDHPDLSANLWTNPGEVAGNGRDDDGDGFVDDVHGADFTANTGDPSDSGGHGTAVAGVIGAVGNNGAGVTGVLWKTRIMPLKFMGAGGGYTSDAVRAIDYAVAHGAKVINTSWGGTGTDPTLAAAIDRARAAGAVVVSAAGNDGRNTDNAPFYPAAYSVAAANGVSVAAVTQAGTLASYSNYGAASVTLAAPGDGLLTTADGGGYAWESGTSVAAPQVSGALALVWDRHADWSYQQVIAKLKSSVDALPALAGKVQTGGRLNLAKLLDATGSTAAPAPPTAPPPPAASAPTVPVSPPPVVAVSPPTPAAPAGPAVTQAAFGGVRAGQFDRVTLTFSASVDPASLAAGVTVAGPLGDAPVSAVVPALGSNNTRFTLLFRRPQSEPGTYLLTVGSGVRTTAGGPVTAYTLTTPLGAASARAQDTAASAVPSRAARVLSAPETIAAAAPAGAAAVTRAFADWPTARRRPLDAGRGDTISGA